MNRKVPPVFILKVCAVTYSFGNPPFVTSQRAPKALQTVFLLKMQLYGFFFFYIIAPEIKWQLMD